MLAKFPEAPIANGHSRNIDDNRKSARRQRLWCAEAM